MKDLQKKLVLLGGMVCCSICVYAQQVAQDFKTMHQQYYGKWPKTITFVQKTEMYRADTVFRSQTWYEAGIFPKFFRIDLGDPKEGNAVIYRGDSTYHFRKSKLVKANVDPNILVYLLGGMFFDGIAQVNDKLKVEGFDLSQTYRSKWQGKDVVIFGTSKDDNSKSQLWYDVKTLYLVRMIQITPTGKLECHFSEHQKTGKVWHEGFVKIFVGDKLVQTETYSDFKIDVLLNPDFFDPNKFGTWHWMK